MRRARGKNACLATDSDEDRRMERKESDTSRDRERQQYWRAGCIWAIRYLENYTHKGACEKQSKEGQVYSGTDTETKKSSRTGSEGGNKGNGELQSIQKKGKRGVSSLCVFSQ